VETNMYMQFMEVVCYTNLIAILISLIFITKGFGLTFWPYKDQYLHQITSIC